MPNQIIVKTDMKGSDMRNILQAAIKIRYEIKGIKPIKKVTNIIKIKKTIVDSAKKAGISMMEKRSRAKRLEKSMKDAWKYLEENALRRKYRE